MGSTNGRRFFSTNWANACVRSVTLYDDGRMVGGLGSRPFDGEGLPTRKNTIVERGVLKSYLLDTYSGKKLGLPSTGNASRSVGESPSVGPTNFYLAPGMKSPRTLSVP